MNNDYPSLKVSFHEQTNRLFVAEEPSIGIPTVQQQYCYRYSNKQEELYSTVLRTVLQQIDWYH